MTSPWLILLKKSWWLFVLCIVASIALALFVTSRVPERYSADRQLLFTVPPTLDRAQGKVNPLLNFVPSLSTAVEVVGVTLNDPKTVDRLAPEDSGIEYLARLVNTQAPVLDIVAEAPTGMTADSVADRLVEEAAANLANQQKRAGAPRNTWITSSLISSSDKPERVWSEQARIAILTLGACFALSAVFLSLLAYRIRRRQHGKSEAADDERSAAPDQTAADRPELESTGEETDAPWEQRAGV